MGLGNCPRIHGLARSHPQRRQLHPVHADRIADDLRDGLEAAKTRPANEDERAEMRRVLMKAWTPGMCGFSIQRFGVDSVQGDYDALRWSPTP